jgi:hypothetical protein
MTSKQTTCHVSRNPLEREIGSDEPSALAMQVKGLSEESPKPQNPKLWLRTGFRDGFFVS